MGDSAEDLISTPLDSHGSYQVAETGVNPSYDNFQAIITNQDQGVMIAWYAPRPAYCQTSTYIWTGGGTNSGCVTGVSNYEMIKTSGSSIISRVTLPSEITYINPILQAQDRTFYGVVDYADSVLSNADYLAKFDASGNIQWTVPNYYALVATADGGVIAQADYPYNGAGATALPSYSGPAITFDANGNQTGQMASVPTAGWTGNSYQIGSVEKTLSMPVSAATPPYWSFAGSNQSSNSSSPLCHDDRDNLVAEYGSRVVLDSYFAALLITQQSWPRFTPTCFLFTNSAQSQYFTFNEINTPQPNVAPEYAYALVRNPLVVPATAGYGLDLWRQLFGASTNNQQRLPRSQSEHKCQQPPHVRRCHRP